MAIAIDFPMFDTTDPKLSKSASSLESALAQFHKNAAPVAAADNSNNSNNDIFTPASGQDGSGFDEWLAADLQFGTLSGDDSSSLTSSPYSTLDDSPVLGFESFADVNSSLFDMPLSFGNEFLAPTSIATAPLPLPVKPTPIAAPIAPIAPVAPLTTAAVQQAAAALNIPWSRDLELAVMAQAASSGTTVLPVAVIPKVEPVEQTFNLVASTPMLTAASMAVSLSETRPKCNKRRAISPEEEQDEIVAKRAKNTDAARRSRMKKLIRLEGLEAKVSDLETAHTKMTLKVAILETEKSNFISKEAEQNIRIAQLEAKLAEAHAALTNRS
ncbi:hypothetical protein CPC16_006731 [Podila verticillata]|nr:hypothetical protein CPC16_006731 [Podila verticillata]